MENPIFIVVVDANLQKPLFDGGLEALISCRFDPYSAILSYSAIYYGVFEWDQNAVKILTGPSLGFQASLTGPS